MKTLPRCFAKQPQSKEQAKKKKLGYYYSRKGDKIILHGKGIDWEGRIVGKVSPKFPNETQSQMYSRYFSAVPDDAPISISEATIEKVEVAREAPEEIIETYGNCPEPRNNKDRAAIYAVGVPCPIKLEGTKWKQIKQWCQDLFDEYVTSKEYLTITGLLSFAAHLDLEGPKRDKLVRRIKAIYRLEFMQEQANTQALLMSRIERAIKSPESDGESKRRAESQAAPCQAPKRTKEKGRDAWGTTLNTRTSRINRAITDKGKTLDQLEKEVNAHGISSHLSKLVRNGFVVRTADKKYKLAPGVEPCQSSSSPSKSASSEKKSSGRQKKASRKEALRTKSSDRASSTRRSPKVKRDKSAKRPKR